MMIVKVERQKNKPKEPSTTPREHLGKHNLLLTCLLLRSSFVLNTVCRLSVSR